MSYDFIELSSQNPLRIREEVITGLTAAQPYISPKYLYDPLGSKLFEAICELPEYYPTRTEAAIFAMYAQDIAASVGRGRTLIDLGAGNCAKAAQLFDRLQPSQYVPIDISVTFLRDAVSSLHSRFPEIPMLGIGMDFSQDLTLPDSVNRTGRLFFYPGSSIGNYPPDEALQYLQRIRGACQAQGGLLIGIDLVKDIAVLDAAYDDALGVTAAFNLNTLRHLNNLLDADFNVRDWQHRGFFSAAKSRIEMHLEARHALTVCWQGGERHFKKGDYIHTESSYKYTEEAFCSLLKNAGFTVRQCWTDAQGWFMVCHAEIGPMPPQP